MSGLSFPQLSIDGEYANILNRVASPNREIYSLMAAVVHNAVVDWKARKPKKPKDFNSPSPAKRKRARQEHATRVRLWLHHRSFALAWFLDADEQYVFSFRTICSYLEYSPLKIIRRLFKIRKDEKNGRYYVRNIGERVYLDQMYQLLLHREQGASPVPCKSRRLQ